MHYKFKAMQKVLSGVGRKQGFSERPVFQKFKNLSEEGDMPERKLKIIENEIKQLESNLENNIKEGQGKYSSENVEAIMKYVEKEMNEALMVYLEAWHILADLQKKRIAKEEAEKEEEKIKKQEKETEKQVEEKKEEAEKESLDKRIDEMDELVKILQKVDLKVLEENDESLSLQDVINIEKEITLEEELQLARGLERAEEAEYMLMEVEKLMANTLNDNPMEG